MSAPKQIEITIRGPAGSGKSLAATWIADALFAQGFNVEITDSDGFERHTDPDAEFSAKIVTVQT